KGFVWGYCFKVHLGKPLEVWSCTGFPHHFPSSSPLICCSSRQFRCQCTTVSPQPQPASQEITPPTSVKQ
ncbi:hypothetical protein Tsubulata_040112, partial [Turnera subulata]